MKQSKAKQYRIHMQKTTIKINGYINVPKYLQNVGIVKNLIRQKVLGVGSPLPSIRQICLVNNLSQETVLKAYKELKESGIIKARERQGYFVQTDRVDHRKNIFLLFDELSEYKKILYNTIREGLDKGGARTKIFFHHCNIDVFESLIINNREGFNMFVIMPFAHSRISAILEELKGKDVLLLDRKENLDVNKFNFIAQDFDNAVFDCLASALDRIQKYRCFILVFPQTDSITSNAFKAPKDIKIAFGRFCSNFGIEHKIVSKVEEVRQGEAFFFVDDMDMVKTIEMAKKRGMELGSDIGVLSYNDFPLKRVVGEGITVISTDFVKMGEALVEYVLKDTRTIKSIMATELIPRRSL